MSISSRSWSQRTGSPFLWFGDMRKRSKYWTTVMTRTTILNSCANSVRFSDPLARMSSRSHAAPLLDDENDRIERQGCVRPKDFPAPSSLTRGSAIIAVTPLHLNLRN